MTAASNRFQVQDTGPAAEQQDAALSEFEGLVTALGDAGIDVVVVDDTREPHTPDSVFPNNWVSFHADGRVVLYPMEAKNRRTERRRDIVSLLQSDHGFHVSELVDLSAHESDGHYLEGTGSMVLDRANHDAYACLSSRTHLDPLGEFAQRFDYDILAFGAHDSAGVPIYHTNVLMNVGEQLAVICADAIVRESQRRAVLSRLRDTGHEILELSFEQLASFAGNMLELRNASGDRVLAMSAQAWQSLTGEQQRRLRDNGQVVTSPINSIEAAAGGSVRCMLAEVHLPKTA